MHIATISISDKTSGANGNISCCVCVNNVRKRPMSNSTMPCNPFLIEKSNSESDTRLVQLQPALARVEEGTDPALSHSVLRRNDPSLMNCLPGCHGDYRKHVRRCCTDLGLVDGSLQGWDPRRRRAQSACHFDRALSKRSSIPSTRDDCCTFSSVFK